MTSTEVSGDRGAVAAKNQALFREINERIKDLNDAFSAITEIGEWICECAHSTCVEPVVMSPAEYEAIRADGASFFVAPSEKHVWPDIERVTARTDRYWVVEKVGVAGELAKTSDPRTDDGPLGLHTPG